MAQARCPYGVIHIDGTCIFCDRDALRAQLAEVTRERDEARADYLACAEAVGVVYAPDTGPCFAGPVDAVVEHIREVMQRLIDVEVERDEARAKVARREREHEALVELSQGAIGDLRAQVERLREAAQALLDATSADVPIAEYVSRPRPDVARRNLIAALAATDSAPGTAPRT